MQPDMFIEETAARNQKSYVLGADVSDYSRKEKRATKSPQKLLQKPLQNCRDAAHRECKGSRQINLALENLIWKTVL